jgi:hypothetical protein
MHGRVMKFNRYQTLFDDMLSTVWSAPNYCYRAGNLASILEIGPDLERYYNVFGPCPDNERGQSTEPPSRLLSLYDEDENRSQLQTKKKKSSSIDGQFDKFFI